MGIKEDNILIAEFIEVEKYPKTNWSQIQLYINDNKCGDRLNDNSNIDDGYRYHDVIHLSNAAILGWSPVTRWLLGYKNNGSVNVNLEESISAMSFNIYEHNGYITSFVLDSFQNMTRRQYIPRRYWFKESLETGICLLKELHKKGGGKVTVDLNKHTIRRI